VVGDVINFVQDRKIALPNILLRYQHLTGKKIWAAVVTAAHIFVILVELSI